MHELDEGMAHTQRRQETVKLINGEGKQLVRQREQLKDAHKDLTDRLTVAGLIADLQDIEAGPSTGQESAS